MGYMVCRKSWRDPALQTPAAKAEEKKKRQQENPLPFPYKKKGK
jgi:hypothetical protein